MWVCFEAGDSSTCVENTSSVVTSAEGVGEGSEGGEGFRSLLCFSEPLPFYFGSVWSLQASELGLRLQQQRKRQFTLHNLCRAGSACPGTHSSHQVVCGCSHRITGPFLSRSFLSDFPECLLTLGVLFPLSSGQANGVSLRTLSPGPLQSAAHLRDCALSLSTARREGGVGSSHILWPPGVPFSSPSVLKEWLLLGF